MNRDPRTAWPEAAPQAPTWDERCSRWLIEHAAQRAPEGLSERLAEEWLADLAARSGAVSRLCLAVGCCWATCVIAHEHRSATVAATAGAGHQLMIPPVHPGASFFTRRTGAFLLILCLHGALIYLFATGLARTIIEVIPPSTRVTFTEEPQRRTPPLPPLSSEPNFQAPRPIIDEPQIPLGDVDPQAIRVELSAPIAVSAPTPPPGVTRILGGPGRGFPNTDDYYPSAARRMGQTGVAAVRVCADPNGWLTGDPTLAQSSGYGTIDEGALRLARAGSGHYRATTEDGRQVNSCYVFRIRFVLNDQR